MIPRPTGPAVPFTLERAASRARSIERARGLRGPVERTGCVIHAPDRSEQDGKQREPRMSLTPARPARARPRFDHDARCGWRVRGCPRPGPPSWPRSRACSAPPRFRCRRRMSDCEVTARTRRATSDPCACPDGACQPREPEPRCASKEHARPPGPPLQCPPATRIAIYRPGPLSSARPRKWVRWTFFVHIKKLDVWTWGPRHGTARHGTSRHVTSRHVTSRHGTARHGTAGPATEGAASVRAVRVRC